MPLFAIHRKLDPKTSQDERELMVARSIGFVETPLRPIWRRSFAIQTEDRFETWCLYEGRTAEEVVWWNNECSVPFDEVRPVTQWRREDGVAPSAGTTMHWVRGQLDSGHEPSQIVRALQSRPEAGDARWIRLFWDDDRREAYAALTAPDADAAMRFAASAGLPCDHLDVVDQILPTDFAPLYENLGFIPYGGDD